MEKTKKLLKSMVTEKEEQIEKEYYICEKK